jgi:hypothetical protein
MPKIGMEGETNFPYCMTAVCLKGRVMTGRNPVPFQVFQARAAGTSGSIQSYNVSEQTMISAVLQRKVSLFTT